MTASQPPELNLDGSTAIKYALGRIDALQESLSMILAQVVLKEQDETYDGQLMTLATQILGTLREGDKAMRDQLGIEGI
jgi:hypothetical protein